MSTYTYTTLFNSVNIRVKTLLFLFVLNHVEGVNREIKIKTFEIPDLIDVLNRVVGGKLKIYLY